MKAARIIHDQGEKMIYFEDARNRILRSAARLVPFFSAPDPTVKRKTGFRADGSHDAIRTALKSPTTGRWRPTTTLTFSPMITTSQGAAARRMAPAPDRRRLLDPGAGIFQLDPGYFATVTA